MKKLIFGIVLLAITTISCSDNSDETCAKIIAKYDKLIDLAEGDSDQQREIALRKEAELEQAGCY